MIDPNDLVIDDSNAYLFHKQNAGCVPRDLTTHPLGCFANVPAMTRATYDRATWPERIRDMEATKSRLSDVLEIGNYGQPIPPMWQDGYGYCWHHSFVAAVQAMYAVCNEPYVELSAFAGACLIKGYRDQGGMSAEAAEFAASGFGVASAKFWPQPKLTWNKGESSTLVNRKYDTPEMRADAKKRALLEFEDVPGDKIDNLFTNLFDRRPSTGEFSWWGHSVALLDPVEINPHLDLMDPERWGVRSLGSHGPDEGPNGRLVLKGWRARPDWGGITITRMKPAVN